MIFSSEFFHHFDICNKAKFANKSVFYHLKTQILKKYGKLVRYDLQTFEKTWCWECQSAVTLIQMESCHEKVCGGDSISLHKHILEVYELECEDGNGRTYHVPTGEFRYYNYANPRYDKKSARFDELLVQAIQKIPLKQDDLTIPPQTAQSSLEWLTEWVGKQRSEGSIAYEMRRYFIPDTDKRRRYNKVRSQNRVVFGISADLKTGEWKFCRRWQTVKGMLAGPEMNWPPSVRIPNVAPTKIMYSITEEDWVELVKMAKTH